MESVLLVYFKKEDGLFSIDKEPNINSIYDNLKKNNVRCQLYIDKNLSSSTNIADDLAGEDAENIVFYVDNDNYRVTKSIISQIKNDYSEMQIICIGECLRNYSRDILDKLNGDIYLLDSYNENILKIAKGYEVSELNNAIHKSMEDESKHQILNKDNIIEDSQLYKMSEADCEKDSVYFYAMKNGMNSKITGLYPDNVVDNATKHITIEDFELSKSDYESLKNYTSINSALYNISHSKEVEENLKTNIQKAESVNYYLSHYHQVLKNNADNKQYVEFDKYPQLLEVERVDYRDIDQFVNVEQSSEKNRKFSYLSIRNKEDLNEFEKDLEYFEKTGKFKKNRLNYDLEDACRWRGNRSCALRNLVRFNLDSDRNIKPCNACSKSIGNIKDDFLCNLRNAYKIFDKERILRKCSECEVKDSCSKCAMIPDFMSSEEYCLFRKKHPFMDEYLFKKYILGYLHMNAKVFKGIDEDSIEYSCKVRTKMVSNDLKNEDNISVSSFLQLIYVNEQPLIFDIKTQKIIKISLEVAAVIECAFKGLALENIKEQCGNIFNKYDYENNVVDTILNMLIEKGYVKVKK